MKRPTPAPQPPPTPDDRFTWGEDDLIHITAEEAEGTDGEDTPQEEADEKRPS